MLHSGSAKGAREKSEGIDALAQMLNRLLFHERDIKIILENTAHGNLSVGSDLVDFQQLLQNLINLNAFLFVLIHRMRMHLDMT